MFFIHWRTHTARTGVVEHQLHYQCACCGLSTPAVVRSAGTGTATAVYGVGGGADKARAAAWRSSSGNAHLALASAACPQCGALQPALVQRFESAMRSYERRKKLRVPVALGAAAAVGVALGIPAALDLRHSSALAFVALFCALAVCAFAFTAVAWPRALPGYVRGDVWFQWMFPRAESGWVPAPAPRWFPATPPRGGFAHVLALVATCAFGMAGLIALGVWGSTHQTVYVVSAAATGGDLRVRLDGAEAARVGPPGAGEDAAIARVSFRTTEDHRLEVIDAAGKTHAYTLVKGAEHGYVVAPGGVASDLCIVDVTVRYGTSAPSGADDDVLLDENRELVPLTRSYDDVFRAPPSTVDSDASTTRHTLRALSCAALTRDHELPIARKP